MIAYPLCVAVGIAAATVVAARQPRPAGLDDGQRTALHLAAIGGAICGAYLLQLPADLWGWAAPVGEPAPGAALPLGGRTVLGGLLGGWLAVEAMKRRLGIRAPTGDGFALPLAVALCAGRIGCTLAGCCIGRPCAADAWWCAHPDGIARWPVPLAEAVFHAGAALALWWCARRDIGAGRRLAAYLAVYAAVRFACEFVRANPPVLAGLTWYQLLACALFALAGGTWWRRRGVAST